MAVVAVVGCGCRDGAQCSTTATTETRAGIEDGTRVSTVASTVALLMAAPADADHNSAAPMTSRAERDWRADKAA